jgi:hypothetical protein
LGFEIVTGNHAVSSKKSRKSGIDFLGNTRRGFLQEVLTNQSQSIDSKEADSFNFKSSLVSSCLLIF